MQNSLAVLDTTFVGELLSWLHDAEATRSEPEREEFLKDLFEWLAEKFQQLPQGRISLEGAIGIFLSVSTFLYSTWSSSGQMEKRLTEKFMAAVSEKKIPSKIEELGPNLTYRKRYVVAVTDRLRLRKDPSLEAPILAFLLPNTLVEEIDQRENQMRSLVEVMSFDVVPAFAKEEHYEIPDTAAEQRVYGERSSCSRRQGSRGEQANGGKWKAIIRMVKKWNSFHDKIQPRKG